GRWTLQVHDAADRDEGILREWALELVLGADGTGASPAPAASRKARRSRSTRATAKRAHSARK
ncbi:MAG TPA: hypothetical protein VK968_19880, partial [Roseimicrobium sp.]|nr:hypothetical protein [Roseimicrobium sp.]